MLRALGPWRFESYQLRARAREVPPPRPEGWGRGDAAGCGVTRRPCLGCGRYGPTAASADERPGGAWRPAGERRSPEGHIRTAEAGGPILAAPTRDGRISP